MIKNNIEIDVKVKCLEEDVTQAQLVDMLDKLGYDIQLTYVRKEESK